jgi:hypothetical protein
MHPPATTPQHAPYDPAGDPEPRRGLKGRGRKNRSGDDKVKHLYRTVGIAMGAMWAWNQGEPLWEHAVKLGVLLFVGAPLVHFVLKRRARQGQAVVPLSVSKIVVAKVVLVAAALGATWLLRPSMTHADLIVAGGLFATITVLGPKIHPLLLKRR